MTVFLLLMFLPAFQNKYLILEFNSIEDADSVCIHG